MLYSVINKKTFDLLLWISIISSHCHSFFCRLIYIILSKRFEMCVFSSGCAFRLGPCHGQAKRMFFISVKTKQNCRALLIHSCRWMVFLFFSAFILYEKVVSRFLGHRSWFSCVCRRCMVNSWVRWQNQITKTFCFVVTQTIAMTLVIQID